MTRTKSKKTKEDKALTLLEDIESLIARDLTFIKLKEGKLPRQEADDLATYGKFLLEVVKAGKRSHSEAKKKLTHLSIEELKELQKEWEK